MGDNADLKAEVAKLERQLAQLKRAVDRATTSPKLSGNWGGEGGRPPRTRKPRTKKEPKP